MDGWLYLVLEGLASALQDWLCLPEQFVVILIITLSELVCLCVYVCVCVCVCVCVHTPVLRSPVGVWSPADKREPTAVVCVCVCVRVCVCVCVCVCVWGVCVWDREI